ncbi:MAG TPA: TetR/AcrR family transcriptional regulator [Steroidobacteraceae bacterium]|jgi:AcrR family transcriptional regulator|nr:TetR/AcrR family transcriptional regulator [Steroidobacteraceae bacterium]
MKRSSTEARASDRIRATAAELFYRQGIRAVGVDELVTRAKATKPSLYRSFVSKDELIAAYLRDFAQAFWQRFDAAVDAHPGNPRAQLRELFARSARRTAHAHYRGCGLTNAAIEYPDRAHPAHQVVQRTKREVRRRLRSIARRLGVREPHLLADGLTMLLEGAYVSRQIFGTDSPGRSLDRLANQMIDRWPRRKRGKLGGRAPSRR